MGELERMIGLVAGSNYFLVLATSNLAESLRNKRDDVYLQSKIAKGHNKPTIILYVKNKITKEEKIDVERFYSTFNVIKISEVDFRSKDDMERLAKELKDVILK